MPHDWLGKDLRWAERVALVRSRKTMTDDFVAVFNRQLAASGKTISQVAQISGLDRAYVLRLSRGEKINPSPATVVRLFVGLVFDERIIARDPTMVEGLTELLLAGATSSATHTLVGV